MLIADVRPSIRFGKRYVAVMDDNSRIHFGSRGSSTFLDHKNDALRQAYIARHLANGTEKRLIQSLTPSPALFSMALLWSFYDSEKTTLKENVQLLNSMLAKK
jgi:hypothetical protein